MSPVIKKISPRREYNDRYYAKNREKILAKLRINYEADPERYNKPKREWFKQNKDALNARARILYKIDPQKILNKNRKWRYGVDGQDILKDQNFCCAICLDPFDEDKPRLRHLDHEHSTKRVRQWLCQNCNAMIGFAKEDVARLRFAIAYLERHSCGL